MKKFVLPLCALSLLTLVGCTTLCCPCKGDKSEKTENKGSSEVSDQTTGGEEETLYTRIGGQPAIDAAVDLFYVKMLADDRVNHFFEDVSMRKQHTMQKQFIAAALGGPVPYEGRDMRRAHKDLDLTEADFAVVAEHLQASLEELKVDPQVVSEVMAAVGGLKGQVLGTDPE